MAKTIKKIGYNTIKAINKLWVSLLSIILGVLGVNTLTGCPSNGSSSSLSSSSSSSEQSVAYGTPYATFKISGHVYAATNGLPVPGIEVNIGSLTNISQSDGSYSLTYNILFDTEYTNFQLVFSDIDGTNNGTYYNLVTNLVFNQLDPTITNVDADLK